VRSQTLLCYEVTRDLSLNPIDIETPMMAMQARELSGRNSCSHPSSEPGWVDRGYARLVPSARVAHIGLYRDPQSLVAVEYYFKHRRIWPSGW